MHCRVIEMKMENERVLKTYFSKVFFSTDFIAYVLNIPLTIIISFTVLHISGKEILFFSLIIFFVVCAAMVTTVFQLRSFFAPVLSYFDMLLHERDVNDEIYEKARKRFFEAPKKRAMSGCITWLILMPLAILFLFVKYDPSFSQRLLFYVLAVINVLFVGTLYFLSIETINRRTAKTGIFPKQMHFEQRRHFRLGFTLALLVIVFFAIIMTVLIPSVYTLSFHFHKKDYGHQMKNVTEYISNFLRNRIITNQDLSDSLYLRSLKVGTNGYVFVTKLNGKLLIRPADTEFPQTISDEPYFERLSGKQTSGLVEFRQNNREHLLYYIRNDQHGVITISILPLEDLEAQWIFVAIMITGVSVLFMVFLGIAVYYLIWNRLKPIYEFKDSILKISDGDLHYTMANYLDDEMGMIMSCLGGFVSKLTGIIRNIQEVSNELASSSREMSVTSGSFALNAQSQAAAAEEATATAEEVSAGVESVASGTKEQSAELARLTSVIGRLDQSITDINHQIKESAQLSTVITDNAHAGDTMLKSLTMSMDHITDSSRKMTSIVSIINDISDQINLLSLNATIEAARAGESGRGFAVVADEISKLAEQTASSIKEINQFIEGNIQEIQKGSEGLTQTSELFRKIIAGISDISSWMSVVEKKMQEQLAVKEQVTEGARLVQNQSEIIQNATEEQRKAMSEIVSSISSINELIQVNAAGSEQMSANSESVLKMAETLREGVHFFSIDSGK